MFGLSGNRGSHVDQGHARKAKREALTAASMVFLHGIRKDGIAYVGAGWWSATALISDVNYQLASVDTRKKILNAWSICQVITTISIPEVMSARAPE